jgi:hypothetical protein
LLATTGMIEEAGSHPRGLSRLGDGRKPGRVDGGFTGGTACERRGAQQTPRFEVLELLVAGAKERVPEEPLARAQGAS